MTIYLTALFAVINLFGKNRFDSRNWEVYTQITFPQAEEALVYYFPVTAGLYDTSLSHLNDLRIVDGNGELVPFVIREMKGSETVHRVSWERVVNASQNEVTLRLGGSPRSIVNRVTLECSGFFRASATVEASSDAISWDRIAKGPVHRVPIIRPDGTLEERLTLTLPETEASYLRVRLENAEEWTQPGFVPRGFGLMGIIPEYVEQTYPSYVDVQFLFSSVPSSKEDELSWDITLPSGIQPEYIELSLVEPTVTSEYEIRAIWRTGVGTTRPGKKLASGSIIRIHGLPDNPIKLPFPRQFQSSIIRLTLKSETHSPPTVTYRAVRSIEKRVYFQGQRPGPYLLYLRNPGASLPRFDEGLLMNLLKNKSARRAFTGMLLRNPNYAPTASGRIRGISRYGKQILILIIVSGILLWVVIARLHKTKRGSVMEGDPKVEGK
ncbi:MAG: hypothetical protein V2G42_04320 [bacterium JZ-2024 1]